MLWGLIGVYHTQFSVAYFLVSALLSKMFDVGDLLVLTFGNCVLKAEWLSGLWNYTFVYFTFFTFFSKSKKHDFLRFLSCCTRFLEHWAVTILWSTCIISLAVSDVSLYFKFSVAFCQLDNKRICYVMLCYLTVKWWCWWHQAVITHVKWWSL